MNRFVTSKLYLKAPCCIAIELSQECCQFWKTFGFEWTMEWYRFSETLGFQWSMERYRFSQTMGFEWLMVRYRFSEALEFEGRRKCRSAGDMVPAVHCEENIYRLRSPGNDSIYNGYFSGMASTALFLRAEMQNRRRRREIHTDWWRGQGVVRRVGEGRG